MKIGLSVNALGYAGGIERYVRDVICGLGDRGIAPAVFTRRFDASLPESACVEPHLVNASFLPGKFRDHWFSWRLREARRRAGIDVLIGCNRTDSADIAVCGGTHVGFILASGRCTTPWDRWQIALERRFYARAKIIVAHSKLMRDELRAFYGVADSKICVLHPPVDGARFTPVDGARRRQLRKKFGFGEDEIVLLFPSGSHERKGLPAIERALEETTQPVVVAVAGRAPRFTSSRIRYLGFVNQIEECYRAADFTILASRYEPFGLAAVEAMMCGTPAILSSRVGALEVIAPWARFTFEPDDASGLCGAIERAVRAIRRGQTVCRADLLYNPSVNGHVDSLLQLAMAAHVVMRKGSGVVTPHKVEGGCEVDVPKMLREKLCADH